MSATREPAVDGDLLLERGLELERDPRQGWCDPSGEPWPALSTQQAAALAHAWRQCGHSSDDVLALIEAIDAALLAGFGAVSREVFSAGAVPKSVRDGLTVRSLRLGDWLTSTALTLRRMCDMKALLVHLAATYEYFRDEETFLASAPRAPLGRPPLDVSDSEVWLLDDDPRPPELDEV